MNTEKEYIKVYKKYLIDIINYYDDEIINIEYLNTVGIENFNYLP